MDTAKTLANMTPSLLEVALGFDKLVLSILPLMEERNQLVAELASIEAKLEEVQSKCKKLVCDLEESSKKEKRVAFQHRSEIRLLVKKITEVEQGKDPLYEGDMPVTKVSLVTLDKLFLFYNGMWKRKNKVIHFGEGSHGSYVGNVDEVACSQFQLEIQIGEDTATLVQGETCHVWF
jgi:hypothetical protein